MQNLERLLRTVCLWEKIINQYIVTKKGLIHFESTLLLDRIQNLEFSSDFTCHAKYKSIYTKRKTLEQLAENGANIALALLNDKIIVGYAVLDYPNKKNRWARLGEKVMIELKAVEVLRGYRNHGIGRHLLLHLLSHPKLEQKIIYLTAYSWTWDLDYSDLNPQSYRDMLISLYTGLKFMEYQTNEFNICLKPENIFMAKVGKNIFQKTLTDFKYLRFGLITSSMSDSTEKIH